MMSSGGSSLETGKSDSNNNRFDDNGSSLQDPRKSRPRDPRLTPSHPSPPPSEPLVATTTAKTDNNSNRDNQKGDDSDDEDIFFPRKKGSAPSKRPKLPDDAFLVDTDEEDNNNKSAAAAATSTAIPRRNKNDAASAISSTFPTLDATTSTTTTVFADDDMQNLHGVKEGDPCDVHDDVEFIDQVEWADDSNSSNYGELAPRPKYEPMGDPCGCTWDGITNDPSDSDSDTNNNSKKKPTSVTPTCCMDPSCILFACQEECRSNCEAGIYCGNKRITDKLWKKVQVFHAGPKGRGLRLLESVKKGDFILEYVGRAVRATYLNRLFQRYKQERRLYIMALDAQVYLDARKKGSVARYINHSCQPNCVVERWKVRGTTRAGIFAKCDIPKGTELSFDYQWERKKGRAPTKCHCGAPTCRGTLEMPKSLDELELEKTCEGHWIPGSKQPGREIINRSIRILSNEHKQYFYAEVCNFDDNTKKHLVIYRHDWEEVWEDLSVENWQLLDEDGVGQEAGFVIAKKARLSWRNDKNSQKLVSSPTAKPTGNTLLAKIDFEELKAIKPFLYVQTPIKDAFYAKDLIQRCERNCRVTIQVNQFARPPLPPDTNDAEDVEKYKALDESLDGTVWRLTVTGSNVAKAMTILEKNVTYLTSKMASGGTDALFAQGSHSKAGGSRMINGRSAMPLQKTDNIQEVVMPRCVVDNFKRKLPLVREKCRSVNITFGHSESKSKQFAKLILEATLQSDLYTARESIWSHLNTACQECNAPKTHTGIFYRDLGFLGGELPREKFNLLVRDKAEKRLNQDCREDLRKSPFFASFESTQRCTVWVQAEEDKGRIDGSNNIVGEATPDAPRKIFFGCDPKDVSKLWTLVQTRASEVARGVKYLYLGADRVYLPFMIQNGAKFFDFVKRVTGASVIVDHMTGDHLRIDGRTYPVILASNVIDLESSDPESEIERVAVAEEMVRLQIEIYRDHCIRQQNWIFGRDWTLSRIAVSESVGPEGNLGGTKLLGTSSARLQFDEKTISNSCQEIADITAALGSNGSAGICAAIIFYRFIALVCQRDDYESQLKVREIVLACLFLANKAQKVSKWWKRLDAILKAAYQVFYPGASFDGGKEEVLILADKVLLAETEILNILDFDIFWRGTDWMIAAAVESAGFDESTAVEALNLACSGPVLSVGSTLWLRYGIEYVFAAAAGFLRANLEKLCPALSLIPLKVFQAAELIAESVKPGPVSKRGSSHFIFEAGRDSLQSHIPRIKEICVKIMTSAFGQKVALPSSESEKRFRLIGSRDCRRHTIKGVPRSVIKKFILPTIDGASAESKCNIYIGESALPGADDIVLEGSWRAVAIAEHLLRASVDSIGPTPLPPATDISVDVDVLQKNKLQAKDLPGLLSMKNIITGEGWSETIQSEISGDSTWGRKTGGKICVPGKLAASALREMGLRWWIPPQHGPSPTGSVCDMFLVRAEPNDPMEGLRRLTRSFMGQSESFPKLAGVDSVEMSSMERYVAVSLQRWPSEKVESRELEKTKKSKRSPALGMGFSAAALQEMQLLNELHSVIPSPQGHPNFILPVALALPSADEDTEEQEDKPEQKEVDKSLSTVADDIFSLFRTSEENEKVARREKRRKDLVTGPHLVFQPSPFVLERFMQKKKRKSADPVGNHIISPAIFSAWFHDLLSALVHCHTSHVILRSFQPDQIIIDHSGVAKIGGLYRASVISPEDRNIVFDPIKFARASKKERKSRSDDDDDVTNPYIAPENLLGCTKQTKEGDVWSLGCLLAHVLLNKSLFSGRDRHAMLNSIYKIVGSPSSENYKNCKKYPNFERPLKKYKRGVEKALQHILGEDCEKHQGAIELLSKMLHLDPSERISAAEALRHHYMLDYVENSNSEEFRERFVKDWMELKGKHMKSTLSEDDEMRLKERSLKRKAALLAASSGQRDEQDDLYNLDDLFASTDDSKRPRV